MTLKRKIPLTHKVRQRRIRLRRKSEGQRDKGSFETKGSNDQLRHNHTMRTADRTHNVALEPVDIDVQIVGEHVCARHEEIFAFLKEEKGGATFLAELDKILFQERKDLILRQTEPVEIRTERVENTPVLRIRVLRVFDHFMDFYVDLVGRATPVVQFPVLEIAIDAVFGKELFLLADATGAVAGGDGDRLIFVETAEDRGGIRFIRHREIPLIENTALSHQFFDPVFESFGSHETAHANEELEMIHDSGHAFIAVCHEPLLELDSPCLLAHDFSNARQLPGPRFVPIEFL